MKTKDIMKALNEAGPKKDPIKSLTTVTRWIAAGYPGLDDDIE